MCSVSATGQTSKSTASSFAALSAKADAARDANKLDEAVGLYKRALALRPNWTEGWWSLGTIRYDQDQFPEAAQAFRKVVALDANHGTARVMLGLCEFELGHDDSALRDIEAGKNIGIAEDPQLRNVVLYHEGVLLQRKGKFEAAQEALGQLCLLGNQEARVAETLGLVALRISGKATPAEGSPDLEVIQQTGHAACLMAQKKYDEARQEYDALTKEHPQYPYIHYAYGRLLVEINETTAAVEEFKEEIKNQPKDVVSRLQIAAATYKTESATGLPYAEQAVKLDPQAPFAHYLYGLLLLDTDDYRRAIPELEIAKRAFPRDAKVYFALGSAYSRAGREQDAARARAAFARLSKEAGTETNPDK
jgi:tetratricopeptide (TPR) repeat protein